MSRAARPQQLPSGRWRIRWLDADGARRSTVFDRYYDAEHALRERQVEAERIRAGLQSRRPEDHTFSELCDYWMEHRASRKRSAKDDRSIIVAHLRPTFGKLQLARLTVRNVDKFVASRDKLSPKM